MTRNSVEELLDRIDSKLDRIDYRINLLDERIANLENSKSDPRSRLFNYSDRLGKFPIRKRKSR